MHNNSSANVPSGKLPLWTFVIFGITLLLAVGITRWYYKKDSTLTVKTILAIDSTIQQSNLALEQVGLQFNDIMVNKLYDRYHREDALFWKPKFDSVRIQTKKILAVIKAKEQDLRDIKSVKIVNLKAELYSTLKHYYTAVMRQIPFEKRRELNELPIRRLLHLMDERESQSNIFQTTNSIDRIVLLSKIKNDVLLSNNIILNFYVQQSSKLILICGGPYPLVTQNTTCLKAGETLELTAGIVSYDNYLQTTITINNQKIPLTESGNAVYRIKASDSKCRVIPVSITYRDPTTGQTRIVSKNVTYTIFQPSKN